MKPQTTPIKSAEEVLNERPFLLIGIDKFYGHQTTINAMHNFASIQSPDADNTERGEIEDLAKSIDESGLKVTFGLQPKHLEVISETLKKWNTPIDIDGKSETPNMLYSQHFWNDCAKQIGWCPFTLSLYYFNWVQSQKPVHPTPPTLLNELRENADTDSAILDALSTILQVGASMATNGISDEISEWDLPKTTPIKAKRKIVKEAEKWNDVNRKRAIELKNAYDVLSRSYHNRPL